MKSIQTPKRKGTSNQTWFLKHFLILVSLALWALQTGMTQPGTLDPEFGQSGITSLDLSVDNDEAYCTLVLPDGKILVGGTAIGTPVLLRFLSDGTPDPSFGINGVVKQKGFFLKSINAMALLPDGKIIASGSGTGPYVDVIRLKPDGTVDESYGENGAFSIEIESGHVQSLVVQPDGKLVVAGNIWKGLAKNDLFMARLLPEGGLDPAFADGGTLFVDDISGFSSYHNNTVFSSVVLQPDGKILAAGSASELGWYHTSFIMLRLLPDGQPDPSFGTGGLVMTLVGTFSDASTMVIQPDGKIIMAGSNEDFLVHRYLTDGTLDESFANSGMFTKDLNGDWDRIFSIILQPDGKIVTAGETVFYGDSFFALVRLNTDGTLDPAFGTGGIVVSDIYLQQEGIRDIALQPDNRIIAAGYGYSNLDDDIVLARYQPDGNLDASLGGDGLVITSIVDDLEKVTALTMMADGNIICASPFSNVYNIVENLDAALVMLDENGVKNPAFGSNGRIEVGLYTMGRSIVEPHSLERTSEGKILLGGTMSYPNVVDPVSFIYRYFDDGSPSQGFGNNGKIEDETGFESHVMTQQSDNKILVGGVQDGDFTIKRYTYYGQPYLNFGFQGVAKTDISGEGAFDQINDLFPLPDGKILAGGSSMIGDKHQFALALFREDGSLDPGFGNNGVVTLAVGEEDSYIKKIWMQPSGDIIAAGNAIFDTGVMLPENQAFALVRLDQYGNVDESFGDEGVVLSWLNLNDSYLQDMWLDSDGSKILAAGYIQHQLDKGTCAAIIRYLDDGNPDPAFGTHGEVYLDLPNSAIYSLHIQSNGDILAGGTIDGDFTVFRFLSGPETGVLDFSAPNHMVWIYPNPLGSQATLRYTLESDEILSIELYDVNGRMVQTFLSRAERRAGDHQETLMLDGGLPDGNYRLVITNGVGSRTLQVLKN